MPGERRRSSLTILGPSALMSLWLDTEWTTKRGPPPTAAPNQPTTDQPPCRRCIPRTGAQFISAQPNHCTLDAVPPQVPVASVHWRPEALGVHVSVQPQHCARGAPGRWSACPCEGGVACGVPMRRGGRNILTVGSVLAWFCLLCTASLRLLTSLAVAPRCCWGRCWLAS